MRAERDPDPGNDYAALSIELRISKPGDQFSLYVALPALLHFEMRISSGGTFPFMSAFATSWFCTPQRPTSESYFLASYQPREQILVLVVSNL